MRWLAQEDCARLQLSLVILSFAPTRHRLTSRAIPELICRHPRTDNLISHRWVKPTSVAVMRSLSGDGASGQTIHDASNPWGTSGVLISWARIYALQNPRVAIETANQNKRERAPSDTCISPWMSAYRPVARVSTRTTLTVRSTNGPGKQIIGFIETHFLSTITATWMRASFLIHVRPYSANLKIQQNWRIFPKILMNFCSLFFYFVCLFRNLTMQPRATPNTPIARFQPLTVSSTFTSRICFHSSAR